MAANVLVFVELRDSEVRRPSLEAAGVARRLADILGGGVDAVALGPGAGGAAALLGRHGVDRLFTVEATEFELYAAEGYAEAMAIAARQAEPAVILLGGTAMGRDLGARLAAKLRCGCASDLIEIDADPSGSIRGKRPIYSGKAMATVTTSGPGPSVAILRANVFPVVPIDGPSAQAVAIEPPRRAADPRVRTIRVEKSERQELDVAEAPVVVSGGRGLKEAENFRLVRDLANVLDGAVGASRAVVDAGWIGHAHQVGQTGKVVSPNLYVACGISGAVQHLAGMSTSKLIVAINKDPEAPIFKVADYGIVGDVLEILPALTAAITRLKNA